MTSVTEDEEHALAHVFEYSVSCWWNCLGRIGSLVGESVPLGVGFEISKDSAHSQCPLSAL